MKRHFLFALVLTFGTVPLQCATLERLSMDDMIAKSTAIIRGKVTGSSGVVSGPIIFTQYSIQVSERFKGTGANTVDVLVPGGVANRVRQTFSGMPTLNPGDEYVFFLYTDKAARTMVIGVTQGLFSVARDGSIDPMTTRAASRELMLDKGQPVKDQTLVMRLSELRSRITGSLGKGLVK